VWQDYSIQELMVSAGERTRILRDRTTPCPLLELIAQSSLRAKQYHGARAGIEDAWQNNEAFTNPLSGFVEADSGTDESLVRQAQSDWGQDLTDQLIAGRQYPVGISVNAPNSSSHLRVTFGVDGAGNVSAPEGISWVEYPDGAWGPSSVTKLPIQIPWDNLERDCWHLATLAEQHQAQISTLIQNRQQIPSGQSRHSLPGLAAARQWFTNLPKRFRR
jgi:hypothetical protein